VDFFVHKADNYGPLINWVKKNGYDYGALPDGYYQSLKIGNYDAVQIHFTQTQEVINKNGVTAGSLPPLGFQENFLYIQDGDLIFEIQSGNLNTPDDFVTTATQVINSFTLTGPARPQVVHVVPPTPPLTCKTLNTEMVIDPKGFGYIGCDMEVMTGQIDLNRSYCESQTTHQKEFLVPDAYGRRNRYWATLTSLDPKEIIKVYAYSQAGAKVSCTPDLNQ
jgi:hypothetical protein